MTLILLPGNSLDYVFYKQAYDNSFYTPDFPWFYSASILTAEPLYKWYTAFFGVVVPFGYVYFLAINFALCFLISLALFKNLYNRVQLYFWVAFMPVIFPTIFYFSPRSSVPFFLILLGLVLLCRTNRVISLKSLWVFVCFSLAVSFHSQYMLAILFILFFYYMHRFTSKINRISRVVLIIVSVLCFGFILIYIDLFISQITSIFSVLPSGAVATSKLHYFETADEGLRLTTILTILVFPALAFYMFQESSKWDQRVFFPDRKSDVRLVLMLLILMIMGMVVNIVFFNFPQVSGRLSRFSDYVGISILVPAFLYRKMGHVKTIAVLFLLAALSPLLYRTVYFSL